MMRYHKLRFGFTLVELLLVILLMSSLALVATAFVDNAEQQLGFDQTKVRMEQIRRAIIGDTSRTINGQPIISGFVADMGKLPGSLSELIYLPEAVEAWGGTPIQLESNTIGELYGGWRGPYLNAMPESTGNRAFRDGWGNQGQTTDDDADDFDGKNYGWVFTKDVDDPSTTNIDESAQIFLQSLGADFVVDAIPHNGTEYEKDYPSMTNYLITEDDWQTDIAGENVKVQINGSFTSTQNLIAKIFFLKNRSLITFTSAASTPDADGLLTLQFTPDADENPSTLKLPMGTLAVAVICSGTNNLYDGDCSDGSTPSIKAQYFKLIPRAQQSPLEIEWNTQ